MNLVTRVSLGAVFVLLANGCGSPTPGEKPGSSSPSAAGSNTTHSVSLGSDLIGEITSVNVKGNFVVLRFTVGVMPAPGASLGVYREGVKVGQVKVTGPQRDTYTVADVLRGECLPGDQVRPY